MLGNTTLTKNFFLLDPEVIFLNHGSFGACPKPVFEVYQNWQRELERQPVEFLGRRITALLADARSHLAAYLGVEPDEVVYFSNPTTAINMVARSLDLHPGDEVLASDHEYGALDRTWHFICRQTGAKYIQQPIALPITSQADVVEAFLQGVTERTRVIFISHITSPTALIFPIDEICRRARSAGILTIVDGAHAPGQIQLDLSAIGADFYAGACHKWLCAPKGAGFLFARRPVQSQLAPLIVSWGYESEKPSPSQFIDHHEWQGTRDLSAFLSVPAAIEFQAQHDWPAVRHLCHALASQTRARINTLTGLPAICPDSPEWYGQMFAARLPAEVDTDDLKARLYDAYHIEVPLHRWNNQPLIRVSFQVYNDTADTDALLMALRELLDRRTI
jgi:isopenicillin-N epimerase